MDIEKETKTTKRNLKFIKRHSTGFLVGILFFSFIAFILFQTDVIKFGQANVVQNFDITQNSQNLKATRTSLCEDGIFEDNLENWMIPSSYNRVDEEGFYCPRKLSNFLSPNIWYKNLIPTDFESLEIRYVLKNKDNSTNIAPSFIFSIGENPQILRLYIPERNNYIVGCEKIIATNSGFLIKREEIHSLNEPIKWEADSETKIRIMINKRNEARFDINLSYLSALDGKSVEEYFNYNVTLPDPKPESELSKLKIGFGTFKGSCVKPISYKFCY